MNLLINFFFDLFFLSCALVTALLLFRGYGVQRERRIRFEEMQKKMNPERSLFKKEEK